MKENDKNSINELHQMIKNRKQRGNAKGGEFFAMWGFLNIITMIYSLLVNMSFVNWLVMIAAGIIIQIGIVKYLEIKGGYRLQIEKAISDMWIIIVIILPLVFYVLPGALDVFSDNIIMSLIYIILSIGMFATGIMSGQKEMKFGGVIFLIAAVAGATIVSESEIKKLYFSFMNGTGLSIGIHIFTMFFGLIIPGIISKQRELKGNEK